MKRRLAAPFFALIFVLGAAPGRADQTFWSLTTGPVPQPSATATAFNLDYVYFPCQSYARRQPGCPDLRSRGRRTPAYPYIPQNSRSQRPASKAAARPRPAHT